MDEITIKKALLDLRLKQSDVAKELNVSPQHVHCIIKGRKGYGSKRVRRYLEELVQQAKQLHQAG